MVWPGAIRLEITTPMSALAVVGRGDARFPTQLFVLMDGKGIGGKANTPNMPFDVQFAPGEFVERSGSFGSVSIFKDRGMLDLALSGAQWEVLKDARFSTQALDVRVSIAAEPNNGGVPFDELDIVEQYNVKSYVFLVSNT